LDLVRFSEEFELSEFEGDYCIILSIEVKIRNVGTLLADCTDKRVLAPDIYGTR
jgi:hypothetical protein